MDGVDVKLRSDEASDEGASQLTEHENLEQNSTATVLHVASHGDYDDIRELVVEGTSYHHFHDLELESYAREQSIPTGPFRRKFKLPANADIGSMTCEQTADRLIRVSFRLFTD